MTSVTPRTHSESFSSSSVASSSPKSSATTITKNAGRAVRRLSAASSNIQAHILRTKGEQ